MTRNTSHESAIKSRRSTTVGSLNGRTIKSLNEENVFRRLQEMGKVENYVKSDFIVEWISRAHPAQRTVDAIIQEIEGDNDPLYTFYCDMIKARGYTILTRNVVRNAGYCDSPMEEISSRQIQELINTRHFTFNYTVKCPVPLCPFHGQNAVLQFALSKEGGNAYSEGSRMEHTDISHPVEYWYCGVIKGDRWGFLSLQGNTPDTVISVVSRADEAWLGFLIKNRGIEDISEYWKLYTAEKLQEVATHVDVPYHVWVDIAATWIQATKPNQDTVDKIWQKLELSRLNYHYVRKIKQCLRYSGYKHLKQSPSEQHVTTNFFGSKKTTWVRLTRKQRRSLLVKHLVKLKCKCPLPSCPAKLQECKTKCTAYLELRPGIPSYMGNCYLRHSVTKHEIKHWFCLVKALLTGKWYFVSFYANDLDRVKELLKIGNSIRIGMLITN